MNFRFFRLEAQPCTALHKNAYCPNDQRQKAEFLSRYRHSLSHFKWTKGFNPLGALLGLFRFSNFNFFQVCQSGTSLTKNDNSRTSAGKNVIFSTSMPNSLVINSEKFQSLPGNGYFSATFQTFLQNPQTPAGKKLNFWTIAVETCSEMCTN